MGLGEKSGNLLFHDHPFQILNLNVSRICCNCVPLLSGVGIIGIHGVSRLSGERLDELTHRFPEARASGAAC